MRSIICSSGWCGRRRLPGLRHERSFRRQRRCRRRPAVSIDRRADPRARAARAAPAGARRRRRARSTTRSLDALMDRVAASLQRDGVAPGDAIAICAVNSTALRGDLPRRAARRRRRRAARRVGRRRRAFARCSPTPARACCSSTPAPTRSSAATTPACRAASRSTAGARHRRSTPGSPPRAARRTPVEIAPEMAVQHHLFVGDDRHAEGHRPAARHALDARDARRPLRLLAPRR